MWMIAGVTNLTLKTNTEVDEGSFFGNQRTTNRNLKIRSLLSSSTLHDFVFFLALVL